MEHLIFTGFEGGSLFFIAQWTGEGRLDAVKPSRRYLVSGQAIGKGETIRLQFTSQLDPTVPSYPSYQGNLSLILFFHSQIYK